MLHAILIALVLLDMNMGVLSQDEIDALLSKERTKGKSSSSVLKTIKCVVPDISRAISLVMTVLFNRSIKVSGGIYPSTLHKTVLDDDGEMYMACKVRASGNKGHLIFACNQESAGILSDLVMGGKGNSCKVDAADRKIKSLCDLFNQVAIALSQECSSNQLIEFTPLQPEGYYVKDLKSNGGKGLSIKVEDNGAAIEFNVSVDTLKSASFALFLTQEFISNMSSFHKETEKKYSNSGSGKRGNKKEAVMVRPVKFGELKHGHEISGEEDLGIVMDLPLEISVELGRTRMKIQDILALRKGSVIELNKLAGEAVDVIANGKTIARGEVVVLNENFGVKISSLIQDINDETVD